MVKRLRPTVSFRLFLVLCAVALAAAVEPAIGRAAAASAASDAQTSAPDPWLSRVQEDISASEYHVTWQDATSLPGLRGAWHAPNRAHNFRTYFTREGIRVVPRVSGNAAWEWGLRLVGYGRGDASAPVEPAVLAPRQNRITYDRGRVLEWYVNDPHGLEQGFTLQAAPEQGLGVAPVHLNLALQGDLSPVISEDRQVIDFVTGRGERVVHYSDLRVSDASGRKLVAWMEGFWAAGVRGVRLVFEDQGAAYPVAIDPLATSPAWTVESDQFDAQLGSSVATAGDVNGDGFSDVIVGAPFFDNGQANEGRAFVFHGTPSGLSIVAAWITESDQAFSDYGHAVATAGDVNRDGSSDVIVGAFVYDGGQIDEGRVFVYHGSASGLSTTAAWTTESDQASANLGVSVGTAGDVNGDGFSDVIVGAHRFDNGQGDEGRAFVYHGSASGLSTTAAWMTESDQASANLGVSVGTAGDVNGDGFSDVIVGANFFDNGQTNEGRAFVYHGSSSGLSTLPSRTVESDQASALFGFSVATAGDVNGDGFADVIVGAYSFDNDQTDEGRAFVYHGTSSGVSPSPAWTAESDQNAAQFGFSAATAGDVNGDGFSDVVIGAPNYGSGEPSEGRAFVFLGSASGLATSSAWTAESNQSAARFAFAVATAGDVNGDGFADVIVGAPQLSNGHPGEGRSYLFLGGASSLSASPDWTADGVQLGGSYGFGVVVSTAGDVNGDGFSDVIVGDWFYDGGQPEEGRVYLFLGSAHGADPVPAWVAESDQAGARLGVSAGTAGDVNGDGLSDVIVGAYLYDNDGVDEGRAFVYHGSPGGPSSVPDWTAEGDQNGGQFGWTATTAGDVNGDGFSDVLISALMYDHPEPDEGRVYVFHGSAQGLSAVAAWTAEGDQAGAQMGWSPATAGDVNRDGFSDVIVGTHLFDGGQVDEGRAYVYHGSLSGLSPAPAWTVVGGQGGAQFGMVVATAGDVNGDGFSDVLVGAPFFDGGQVDEGRAFVYHGSTTGLNGAPAWTAESDQPGAFFGVGQATAGDVNGDGFSDLIVGAPNLSRAFLYHGSTTGLAATHSWSPTLGTLFGGWVASAGDVNGDGFADVIVGALGQAYIFMGNSGPGLDRRPQQFRVDGTAPIDFLGVSDSESSFRLRAIGRTPAGRGRVRLEWEARALGVPFDESNLQRSAWFDTGPPGTGPGSGSGVLLEQAATGLSSGTPYRWRLRFASNDPFFPRSPWLSLPYNAREETDLRTPGCRDLDGDGFGVLGDPACAGGAIIDCDDADAATHPGAVEVNDGKDNQCPGDPGRGVVDEVSGTAGFTDAGDPTAFCWPPQAGATMYEAVRSDDPTFAGNCTTFVTSATCWSDPTNPPGGAGFFYLVRATAPNVGSWGQDSSGTERTGICP